MKKIILAIDDNKMQLEMFERMLGQQYDLRTVESASNALHYLNSSPADVILLDIQMPNITGFEFLHDIKKIPSKMNVPIIIVSGTIEPAFFDEARHAGAFDVLGKPVKTEELIDIIEKALAAQAKGT